MPRKITLDIETFRAEGHDLAQSYFLATSDRERDGILRDMKDSRTYTSAAQALVVGMAFLEVALARNSEFDIERFLLRELREA